MRQKSPSFFFIYILYVLSILHQQNLPCFLWDLGKGETLYPEVSYTQAHHMPQFLRNGSKVARKHIGALLDVTTLVRLIRFLGQSRM